MNVACRGSKQSNAIKWSINTWLTWSKIMLVQDNSSIVIYRGEPPLQWRRLPRDESKKGRKRTGMIKRREMIG